MLLTDMLDGVYMMQYRLLIILKFTRQDEKSVDYPLLPIVCLLAGERGSQKNPQPLQSVGN